MRRPSHQKWCSFFRAIWKEAVDVLAAASHVFVIGYSFPPTDLHLHTLLRLVGRKRNFKKFDEVFCCTKGAGLDETVFANAVRFLPAKCSHLIDGGFDALVSTVKANNRNNRHTAPGQ